MFGNGVPSGWPYPFRLPPRGPIKTPGMNTYLYPVQAGVHCLILFFFLSFREVRSLPLLAVPRDVDTDPLLFASLFNAQSLFAQFCVSS